jgi:FKBP-type peptidyl-prolyl cis-trans isomerase
MNQLFRPLFLLIALSVALSSCTGYSEKEKEKFDQEIQNFLKKSNLSLSKTSSGVYYKLATKGTGKPILYGDKIRVMYKGKNMKGLIFDEKNTPIIYELKNLIPAWKEVLVGQNAGSVFYIATPPQMGYGSEQAGEIPPNSCLFFEIKVMETL